VRVYVFGASAFERLKMIWWMAGSVMAYKRLEQNASQMACYKKTAFYALDPAQFEALFAGWKCRSRDRFRDPFTSLRQSEIGWFVLSG